MKAILFVTIVLLTPLRGFGQIVGRVISLRQEPVPFANVVMRAMPDSGIVAGAASDETGNFLIKTTKSGEFFLQVSSMGYQTSLSGVFRVNNTNATLTLPDIQLLEETNALNEVVVSARKDFIQNTPEGKIFNIQNSLMTKGSNALQVLERLPGIITDRRNNQFSLNGQSGVTVLLNGRRMQLSTEELMALLENTVADNIERIEVITSPGAQYDADGGAGVINIVLKKNENEGTRLNFSATGGYGYREKALTSLSLSRGGSKITLNASYAFAHGRDYSGYEGSGTNEMPFLGGKNSVLFGGLTDRNQNAHNFNLAAEFRPATRWTFGGEMAFSWVANHNLVHIYADRQLPQEGFLSVRAISDGLNHRQNLVSSAYVTHRITEKSQLSLDASYITYTNDSPALLASHYSDKDGNPVVPQNPIFTYGNRGESKSTIQIGVLKADYSLQLNSKIYTEFGMKGSLAMNMNNSKVERQTDDGWEPDPRSQSNINGQERIWAVYSQFRFTLNPKARLQAGLRYEYWQRDINIYQEPFVINGLFPSVQYTYTINDKSNFSLAYNRRISRPAYTDLISNLFYNDATFVFAGNPLLKPTLTDALKADYTFRSFNVGLALQYELHPILRYQISSNEKKDIGISSPQNLDYQKGISLFLNAPVPLTRWWKLSLGSTTALRRYKISYSLNPAEKTYLFQNLNFTQTFSLPHAIEIELSGWQNFPFYEGSNKLNGFGVMNLGIAKKLKNDKGTFLLTLPDLWQTFAIHTHIGGMTPLVFNNDAVSVYRDETALYRVIKLTYSRSFGKNNRSVSHKTDDEEQERVKR